MAEYDEISGNELKQSSKMLRMINHLLFIVYLQFLEAKIGWCNCIQSEKLEIFRIVSSVNNYARENCVRDNIVRDNYVQ